MRVYIAAVWKSRHDALREKMIEVDQTARMSTDFWAVVDRMGEMYQRLPGMLEAVKDINMKRGFNEIVNDGFRQVLSL